MQKFSLPILEHWIDNVHSFYILFKFHAAYDWSCNFWRDKEELKIFYSPKSGIKHNKEINEKSKLNLNRT